MDLHLKELLYNVHELLLLVGVGDGKEVSVRGDGDRPVVVVDDDDA